MKIYALITHHADAAPDMEFFSELPTMDFTPRDGERYELYEGYLDGGDTIPVLITHCYICDTHRAVTKVRTIARNTDPTAAYTLTCSHEVI